MLRDAATALGADRKAAVCRELTKKFEEIRRGTLADLAQGYATAAPKGEVVVLVDRGHSETVNQTDIESDLRRALTGMSVRDAADMVAQAHGLPRRQIYQAALALGKPDNEPDDT
jgi:16S rRNA (cytidine1402-2'-O)-methyltransferase